MKWRALAHRVMESTGLFLLVVVGGFALWVVLILLILQLSPGGCCAP